jgi:polyhydroxyalkanoate synthesis regulator phasin
VRTEDSESKGCIVAESWQSYANLVGGLTRNVRDRAASPVRALLARAGLEEAADDAWERLTMLGEEIEHAARANRDLVENLILAEVDKAAARLGLVRSAELQELRAEVAELRKNIRTQQQTAARARKASGKRAPAKKAAMKKAAKSAAAAG